MKYFVSVIPALGQHSNYAELSHKTIWCVCVIDDFGVVLIALSAVGFHEIWGIWKGEIPE